MRTFKVMIFLSIVTISSMSHAADLRDNSQIDMFAPVQGAMTESAGKLSLYKFSACFVDLKNERQLAPGLKVTILDSKKERGVLSSVDTVTDAKGCIQWVDRLRLADLNGRQIGTFSRIAAVNSFGAFKLVVGITSAGGVIDVGNAMATFNDTIEIEAVLQ